MAKKRINKNDIAPADLFDNVKQGALETKAQIELLTTAIKVLKQNAIQIKSSMPKTSPTSTKGMKDFDEQTRRANETAKAKLNIDKKLLIEKAKLKNLTTQQNKQLKTTVQATQRLTQEQQKSLGTLQKLELHNTKLRATRAKLNLETKRGQRILQQINAKLDENNAKIRASGDAMKKQRLNVGNYNGAITKLRGGLARLGLAFGVFQLAKDAFNIVKDFEQSQANLASVLGVSVDEMGALTEQSKELGATTKFTASEVAQLQIEYAKLGFSQKQIEGMTEATLQLAGATGSELGEASTVVGGTMRAFGLDAEQTQRVVDVMAKSFSASSLDMNKFNTAMAVASPTAKAMGFNIEQTTALIGTLTDANIDASTAGTGLRNMFLDAKKNGLTLDEALEKINGSTDKVKTSFDLFGKRGVTLGLVLAENTEGTNKLEASLFNAGGSAKDMADKQLDTLNGALALLRSAWEGVVLKFEEGVGVFGFLKDIISFVAKNLETLLKTLVSLGTAFGVYKLINLTTKSFKALTLAMNANPFILIASVVAGAVTSLVAFTGELSRVEKAQKTVNDVMESAKKATVDQKSELEKLLLVAQDKNRSDDERILAVEKLNEISPEFLGNLTLENVATEEGVGWINKYTEALDKKARAQAIDAKRVELHSKLLDAQNTTLEEQVDNWDALWLATKRTLGQDIVAGVIDIGETALERKKDSIADIMAELEALNKLQEESDAEDLLNTDPNADPDTDPDKPKKLKDLARKIKDEQIKQIEDEETREIEARIEKGIRLEEDTKKLIASGKQKAELLKEQSETLESDLAEIEEKWRLKKLEVKNKSLQDFQKVLILEKEMELNGVKEGSEKELELLDELDALKIEQLKQNAEIRLQNKELEATEEALIITTAQKKIDDILKAGLKRRADMEKKAKEDKQKAEEKAGEIAEAEWKKEQEKRIELAKSATDLITDQFTKSIDERISKIDEEVQAHKDRANELKKLANEGNITAQESLAEENRLIAEADREKAEQEEKKRRLLMVSAFIKTYLSAIDNQATPSEALIQASTNQAFLDQIVGNIGSFFDGTEDTGKVNNPLDTNGGRLSLLHNNERVMTAKQNARIGNVSNEEVARVMENNRLGRLIDGHQIGVGWENIKMLEQLSSVGEKLDIVNNTIKNKPEQNIELGAITQKMFEVIETKRKGGLKTVSTFKVRNK